MKAITVTDPNAGTAGTALTEQPEPHASENDVIVRVHASGFTPGELAWPGTWTDRVGRDRTPSLPGHELSGVVTALGLDGAVQAFNSTERPTGKIIVSISSDAS